MLKALTPEVVIIICSSRHEAYVVHQMAPTVFATTDMALLVIETMPNKCVYSYVSVTIDGAADDMAVMDSAMYKK